MKSLNSGDTTLDAHNYDGKGSHKSIEEGKAIITSYGNLYGVVYDVDTVTKKGRIDCGTNEELFLAIAAFRDDTDKFQWFTDGDLWFKCGDEVCDENIEYYLNKYGRKIHKATVNELIEHFKTEEEQ